MAYNLHKNYYFFFFVNLKDFYYINRQTDKLAYRQLNKQPDRSNKQRQIKERTDK